MEKRDPENKVNVFLEALNSSTEDSESKDRAQDDTEKISEPAGFDDMEDAVVPAEDPDISGRAALGIARILKKIFTPVGKVANTFFAPVLKPFRKGADKITGRDWALFLTLIVIIGVAVASPMVVMRTQNTYNEEESIYASVLGQLFTWEDGGRFFCEDDVTTFTPEGEDSLDMSGVPFYYSDENKLLWPNLGVWYSVEKDQGWGRVTRFSTVTAASGDCVITTAKGAEYHKAGFLYDNADTYLFLETVTLYYNEKELLLPALSCVEVQNGTTIDIYSYGGESYAEILTTDVTAEFSGGARLDLSGDILYYYNGIFRLIYCDLENIPLIEE